MTLLGPVVATAIGLATGLEGRAGSAALFLVAVLVSTLVGGFAFGVATAVLSYVPYLYYFVEPVHSFAPSGSGYAAVLAFAGAVALVVLLLHREQRARTDALGAHETAMATAAQMERLQRLAALLSAAATPSQIARILVGEGSAAVGATAGWVSVLSDETGDLEHLSSVGYEEAFVAGHRLIPLAGTHVAAEVARTGQPLWLETTYDAAREELRSARQATGAEALALVPLRTTTDAPLGFMALRFQGPRVFTAADRDLLETFARQASEALQRSRLFDSERQARRVATRLQSVTAALSAAAEPSDVAAVIVDQTLEAFDATSCHLYISAQGELRLAGQAGADPAPATGVPGDVERAIGTGQVAASRAGDRSSIAVPLALGTRVFGALHIVAEAPRAFDGADRTLAEAVASRCAQALERAELYQREWSARRTAQVATERLVRLQAMTAALATAVTVQDVTEIAVAQGTQAFGADAAAAHLVSDDAEALVVAATMGYPDDGSARTARLSMEEPLAAIDAVRRGKILWFASQASLERRFPADAAMRAPWEATGLVPLVGREGPLGLLTLRFRERRPRRREDRALLATIGRQCGQAIERARLYEHERDARELESRLQQLTAAISGISGVHEMGDRVTEQLASLLGASSAVVALPDPRGTLRPLATGDATGSEEQGQELVSRLPVEEAVIAGAIVVRDGPAPAVGVPLVAGGRTIGALGIQLERSDGFAEAELELLEALGPQVAEAIERARLYDDEQTARAAAQRANERLRTLEAVAQAGLAARSLDELIESLLPLVRDLFGADRASLLLVDAERHELRMKAAVGLDAETIATVRLPIGRGIAGTIAETGQAVRIDDVVAAQPVSEYLRRFGGSLLGVPLRVDGRVTGVLHVTSDRRAAFDDRDLRLLAVAGDRFALALERMSLYEREHETAVTLQRSVLPERMPELDGLQLAARYVPGSTGVQVGGDWYDAIELGAGRVGIVVGDVVGKGVLAAATMAQLRNALRVYAMDGLKPMTVLAKLNRLAETTGPSFATVLYAIIDTTTHTCRYASAGHPPPLLVRPDGSTEFLEGGRSIPIGVHGEAEYSEDLIQLEPGDAIVVYTDGLVERRGSTLDAGLEQLRDAASVSSGVLSSGGLEALLDHVVRDLLGDQPSADDVAVLALSATPRPTELVRSFPAQPAALAEMRSSLRDWLSRCRIPDGIAEDLVLASSEACANAVEHAEDPTEAVFDLRAEKIGDDIVVSVRDYGRWREPRERSDRGFGLKLMAGMVDAVEITRLASGTEVQLRRRSNGAVRVP